jgi:hypothetical protein
MNKTVGNILAKGKEDAIKSLAVGAGVVVYVGMLLYSGVHNYSIMTRGIEGDMIIWALLGVAALEISAACLPLALHFWTYATTHRMAALAFYAVDIGLIVANVVLDYAITAGETLPEWIKVYQFYGAPIVPIIAGLGWSVLFLLDPSQKERATNETVKAATREALALRIAEQAQNADINAAVEQAAAEMARALVSETLGVSLAGVKTETAQSATNAAPPKNAKNNGNGSGTLQNVEVYPLAERGNGRH